MTTVAKGEGGFSSERIASAAGLHVPAYMVWGANTDVGKTLVSAGLCRALVESDVRPVVTWRGGPPGGRV
jgi:predicted GTPase